MGHWVLKNPCRLRTMNQIATETDSYYPKPYQECLSFPPIVSGPLFQLEGTISAPGPPAERNQEHPFCLADLEVLEFLRWGFPRSG